MPTLFAIAATIPLLLNFAQAWWNPIQDPDLFWLLWAGRQMLAGHFPTVNTFSWTAPQTSWILHEPLVALGYAVVGLEHVGLVRGVIVTVTAVLLTVLAWRKSNAWATVFALCWGSLLVFYGTTERALSWGNLLLALLALLLYRVEVRRRWRMPAAAVLVALWANVHGSFIIGILMVGIVSWAWGLLAAALCLFNPSGIKLYSLIIGYGVGSNSQAFIHTAIPEWTAVDLTSPLGWVRVACLLAAGYLLIRDHQWRFVVLWVLVGALALVHQRFFDILGIALLPAVSNALARRLPARDIRHPAPILATILLAIALFSPHAAVDEAEYPTPLLAHLPNNAKIWHEFSLGGWLGYHDHLCFWDSRNDCYPLTVLEDGLRIQSRGTGWSDTLSRWDVQGVMTLDCEKIKQLTAQNWQEEARHGKFVLLMRPTVVDLPPKN